MIRSWFKKETEIRSLVVVVCDVAAAVDTKRLKGARRVPIIQETVEQELVDWFNEQQDPTSNDRPLKETLSKCMTKLCQLDTSLTDVAPNNLQRRILRIFQRSKITDRLVTHYAQKCQRK
jgi:hypothetical protein